MNSKEYISSGILELYVAGMLTESEIAEVQAMAKEHPEIQAEIEAIEHSLGKYAEASVSTSPDPSILSHALAQIEEEESIAIVPLRNKIPNWAWAAVILLFISLGLNYFLLRDNFLKTDRIELVEQELKQLKNDLSSVETQLANYESPDFQKVILASQENSNKAIVMWNPQTREAILHALALPELDTDKDFQLWVINSSGANPIGVFDTSGDTTNFSIELHEVTAFAISREPKGGSAQPTEVLVVGNV